MASVAINANPRFTLPNTNKVDPYCAKLLADTELPKLKCAFENISWPLVTCVETCRWWSFVVAKVHFGLPRKLKINDGLT